MNLSQCINPLLSYLPTGMNLQQLFDIIKTYGINTRKNSPIKGLENWNKIKSSLPLFQTTWLPHVKEMYQHMKEVLGIIEDEKDALSHEQWEYHHFFLQHVRIPTLNFDQASLMRLMQIAYNAGQYSACLDHYSAELKKYYIDNKLDCLETYMSPDDIVMMDDFVTEDVIVAMISLCNDY